MNAKMANRTFDTVNIIFLFVIFSAKLSSFFAYYCNLAQFKRTDHDGHCKYFSGGCQF